MVYDIVSLPVTILFIVGGLGLFYYAIKLNDSHPEEHNFTNSILALILWITAGLLYPLFFSTNNPSLSLFLVLSVFFICIFTPSLIILILYYQYQFVVKKNPNTKVKRNFNTFLKHFDKELEEANTLRSQKLKTEMHRKALHLFPAGVIIFLWIFGVYIWDNLWNARVAWGITGREFSKFLILTVGYSGILVFGALDYIRLSCIFENHNLFHLIPDNVLNLLRISMKRKENFEFIRPAVLILSFVPIFFFPFGVFTAAILIATIGDGAASIFGLRFGKINFPKSSEKTIIGYLAGFFTSFIVSIIPLVLFESILDINEILIIAFGGASMYFVIDISNLKIDDNILNPILCALIMGFLYFQL